MSSHSFIHSFIHSCIMTSTQQWLFRPHDPGQSLITSYHGKHKKQDPWTCPLPASSWGPSTPYMSPVPIRYSTKIKEATRLFCVYARNMKQARASRTCASPSPVCDCPPDASSARPPPRWRGRTAPSARTRRRRWARSRGRRSSSWCSPLTVRTGGVRDVLNGLFDRQSYKVSTGI